MVMKLRADIVIVGAGLAGLVAAIEARSSRADVLLLEKLPSPERWNAVTQLPGGIGNDTWRSGGGGLARFANDVLVQHLSGGFDALDAGKDPADILFDRHMERGWGEINVKLLRIYLNRIFSDCRWLRDDVGLPYDSRGRSVKDLGIGLFKWLHKTAIERGAQLMFSVRAESLIIDRRNAVCGLRVSRNGETVDIETRAVVLATGGFQGSREMLRKHASQTFNQDIPIVGSPDNTGDGHRLAIEVGAVMRHSNLFHVRTTDIYFGPGPSRYLGHIYPMGIYFNCNFERFIDEGVADSDTIANAIVLQPGSTATLIFDDKARRRYPEEYENYPRREQLISTAGDVAELAHRMGLSSEALCRLVQAFNAKVKNGQASGPNLAKSACAVPLDTPPYHGFHPVRPAINHSLGGLVVEGETCMVVDAHDRPIAGLYAAGTILNWAYGRSYQEDGITTFRGSYHAGASSGAGIALVTGRLAAQSALVNIDAR